MEHLKKYWLIYIVAIVVIIVVAMNWKTWFPDMVSNGSNGSNGSTLRGTKCRCVAPDGTIYGYPCDGPSPAACGNA